MPNFVFSDFKLIAIVNIVCTIQNKLTTNDTYQGGVFSRISKSIQYRFFIALNVIFKVFFSYYHFVMAVRKP